MYAFQHGIIASSGGGETSTEFIMTIDTTNAGSASDTFILPARNTGTYNAIIDWGDDTTSTITAWNDADLTHVYSVGGVYQIKINGSLPNIYFNNGGDKLKVISIDNWGLLPFIAFDRSFYGCTNLDILATDKPNFSSITSMGGAFYNCTSLTNFPFDGADFSNVTLWNQSGLSAFYGCTSLTSIDMTGMLMNTTTYYSLASLFYNCTNLNIVTGFNTLNLSKCTGMIDTFRNCDIIYLDMSGLNFSSCTDFTRILRENTNITNLYLTDITLNSVGNISMTQALQALGTTNIIGLDTWNIAKITSFNTFMGGSSTTTVEYDKLLISWDIQDAVDSLAVNFGTSQYTLGSAAATARAGLIANDLWTITDGGGI